MDAKDTEGIEEKPGGSGDDLVVVAAAATLQAADVLRATLRSAGIDAVILNEHAIGTLSHLGPAVHPDGVRVAVHPADAPPARQVLALRKPDADEDEESDENLSADEYAHSAWRLGVFSCIFPPLLFVTLYVIVRSLRAASRRPPADPYTFRRRLRYAFLLGVLAPAVLVAILIALAAPTGWGR